MTPLPPLKAPCVSLVPLTDYCALGRPGLARVGLAWLGLLTLTHLAHFTQRGLLHWGQTSVLILVVVLQKTEMCSVITHHTIPGEIIFSFGMNTNTLYSQYNNSIQTQYNISHALSLSPLTYFPSISLFISSSQRHLSPCFSSSFPLLPSLSLFASFSLYLSLNERDTEDSAKSRRKSKCQPRCF